MCNIKHSVYAYVLTYSLPNKKTKKNCTTYVPTHVYSKRTLFYIIYNLNIPYQLSLDLCYIWRRLNLLNLKIVVCRWFLKVFTNEYSLRKCLSQTKLLLSPEELLVLDYAMLLSC